MNDRPRDSGVTTRGVPTPSPVFVTHERSAARPGRSGVTTRGEGIDEAACRDTRVRDAAGRRLLPRSGARGDMRRTARTRSATHAFDAWWRRAPTPAPAARIARRCVLGRRRPRRRRITEPPAHERPRVSLPRHSREDHTRRLRDERRGRPAAIPVGARPADGSATSPNIRHSDVIAHVLRRTNGGRPAGCPHRSGTSARRGSVRARARTSTP